VHLFELGLHPDVYERLKRIAGSRITAAGELLITARRFRTQDANRADARRRLAEMIAAAHMAPRKRKPTRPSKAAKAERVEKKRQRSAVKQARGRVEFD
jgi:ribosome-associated protein